MNHIVKKGKPQQLIHVRQRQYYERARRAPPLAACELTLTVVSEENSSGSFSPTPTLWSRRPSIQIPITRRAQRSRPLQGHPSANRQLFTRRPPPLDQIHPFQPSQNHPSALPNVSHDSNWILLNSVAAAAAAAVATLGLVINLLLLWSSAVAGREEVQWREGGRRGRKPRPNPIEPKEVSPHSVDFFCLSPTRFYYLTDERRKSRRRLLTVSCVPLSFLPMFEYEVYACHGTTRRNQKSLKGATFFKSGLKNVRQSVMAFFFFPKGMNFKHLGDDYPESVRWIFNMSVRIHQRGRADRSRGWSQMTGEKEAVQWGGHGVTHLSRWKKGTVLISGGSSCSLGAVMNKLLFQTPESFSNSRSITETDHEGLEGPSAAVGTIKSFYQDKCLLSEETFREVKRWGQSFAKYHDGILQKLMYSNQIKICIQPKKILLFENEFWK